MSFSDCRGRCLLCVSALFSFTTFELAAATQSHEPLPEPLTLTYALSLADTSHPQLQIAEADIRQAQAEQFAAESDDDINLRLEGRLRHVNPADFLERDKFDDDNRLALTVSKRLYDFGRTSSTVSAAGFELEGQRLKYLDARQQRRIEIMRRYFDVLLADLLFYQHNEKMAVEFVDLDRLRDRQALGQVSELTVQAQEVAYQRARVDRFSSQNLQRVTRAQLAQALNRPGELPATLSMPELPQLTRKLEDVEVLQKKALTDNALLNALRVQIEAARQRIAAARADKLPTITGEAGKFEYGRKTGTSDEWGVGVTVDVPLYQGGRVDAAVAKEQAKLYRAQAQLAQAQMTVQQAVLEIWLRLDNLSKKRDEARARNDFQEFDLDRSRALYEMEVTADLGDAMVRVTEAQYDALQTDFAMALALAELNALLGAMDLQVPLSGATVEVSGGQDHIPRQ